MATKIKEAEERIEPIKITDQESGKVYILDFNRESVMFAESRGFDTELLLKFPVTHFPDFLYYSLRANHRNVARNQSDNLYERLGGYSPAFLERLLLLYNQAAQANNIVENTEDMGKNGNLTVEL